MAELSDLSPVPLPKAQRLSKSKFLSGLQCHKRLYLEVHHPSLAPRRMPRHSDVDMGTESGVARSPPRRYLVTAVIANRSALAQTAACQDLCAGIFGGVFARWVLIRSDVWNRVFTAEDSSGWRLIEVQSLRRSKTCTRRSCRASDVILGAG